jgi:hypothetical protein
VQSQAAEAEAEHDTRGLNRESMTVIGGIQDEADLAALVVAAHPPQADVADDLSDLPPDNPEHQSIALALQCRPSQVALERLP